MRSSFFLAFVLTVLGGCASGPKPAEYGNFVSQAPRGADKLVVGDVVKTLVGLYPPAKTRFNLQQTTTDSFGSGLVASLRAQGYALLDAEHAAQEQGRGEPGVPSAAYRLAYVFDQPVGTDLFRVTVNIGQQSISRIYRAHADSVSPAGTWVRKE